MSYNAFCKSLNLLKIGLERTLEVLFNSDISQQLLYSDLPPFFYENGMITAHFYWFGIYFDFHILNKRMVNLFSNYTFPFFNISTGIISSPGDSPFLNVFNTSTIYYRAGSVIIISCSDPCGCNIST